MIARAQAKDTHTHTVSYDSEFKREKGSSHSVNMYMTPAVRTGFLLP